MMSARYFLAADAVQRTNLNRGRVWDKMGETTGLLPDLWGIVRGYMDVDEQWYMSLALGSAKGDAPPDPDEILRVALDRDRPAIFRHALGTLAKRMQKWNIMIDETRLKKLCALDSAEALNLCCEDSRKNVHSVVDGISRLPLLVRHNSIGIMQWARARFGMLFDRYLECMIKYNRIEMLEDLRLNEPNIDTHKIYNFAIQYDRVTVAQWIDLKYDASPDLPLMIESALRARGVASAAMAHHLLARMRRTNGENYDLLIVNVFSRAVVSVIDVLLTEEPVRVRRAAWGVDDGDAEKLMGLTRNVTPDGRRDGMRRLLTRVFPHLTMPAAAAVF